MDILDQLKLLIADHADEFDELDDKILNTLKKLYLEITQLRAVAGQARGDESLSHAAIKRDMDHG